MSASAAARIQADQSDVSGDAEVIDLHPGKTGSSASSKTRGMTDDHKARLATGRNQRRDILAYLEALKNNRPQRGRKRTSESIQGRLAKIAEELPTADALQEVLLLQEQVDLEKELQTMGSDVDLSELEAKFIAVGLDFSNRKGIDYAIWRKVGVSADTLAKARIKR